MTKTVFSIIVSCLFFVTLGTGVIFAEQLIQMNVDSIEDLGTIIQADTAIKKEGAASTKITTQWPTTICLAEFTDLGFDNATLVYEAHVRSEDLDGQAYLEMWCFVNDGQYFSRGLDNVLTGTQEWKKVQTPFFLQPGQTVSKAVLNIVINGTGTVWVDDLRLTKE
jgi:hypothetical protein